MSPTSYGMSFSPSCANTALWDMLGPSTQGKPGAGKTSFSLVQSLLWFLSCWKCFTSPETKLGMDKERQTLFFDAAPHYTDLVLHCLLSLRENKHSDGATFFKTASATKDNRQSLREQHIENHFPSIQKAPPEIPVTKWEQVGISKQHCNMLKHTAKNTAAYWIWYMSSRKQVYAHKTMQQDITPGKAWREQCCILTLLRFFSAIASWRQTPPVLSPSSPVLRRCHCLRAGWVQAPEGQAG